MHELIPYILNYRVLLKEEMLASLIKEQEVVFKIRSNHRLGNRVRSIKSYL